MPGEDQATMGRSYRCVVSWLRERFVRSWRRWGQSKQASGVVPERAGDAGPDPSHRHLVAFIKDELRERFEQGERPTAADYLEEYSELKRDPNRVLSLLYEEYCLLEEHGAPPDPNEFCDRYAPWRDSMISQLRYHHELSKMLASPQRESAYPRPGQQFLHYQIQTELGRGGAARVYLAHDESLGGRLVALKISADLGEEPKLQGQLDHPHIVAVTQVDRDPETGLRVMAMPYCAGLPLDVVIRRLSPTETRPRTAQALIRALSSPGPSSDTEEPIGTWEGFPASGSYAEGCAWVALELVKALAFAHRRGIFHRDVKPGNILLARRSGPMLLDFNLAHSTNLAAAAMKATTGGTLPYMAPEQLAAFLDPKWWPEVGSAADLYALGLVLRELLTGLRPKGPDATLPTSQAISLLLEQRRSNPPPSTRAHNPDVPYALEAILARCLAPDPNHRYQDAITLAEDLRRFLAHEPLLAVVNPSRREQFRHWALRNRRALRRAAAAMLFLVPVAIATGIAIDHHLDVRFRAELEIDRARQEYDSGRYGVAKRHYRKALELHPDWYKPWQGLAAIEIKSGNQENGITYFNRAVELASADASVDRGSQAILRVDRANALIKFAQLEQTEASRHTIVPAKCEVELIRSPSADTALPTAGRGLLVVALAGKEARFRAFDPNGRLVLNADGATFADKALLFECFTNQYRELRQERSLPEAERNAVRHAVKSLMDNHMNDEGLSFLRQAGDLYLSASDDFRWARSQGRESLGPANEARAIMARIGVGDVRSGELNYPLSVAHYAIAYEEARALRSRAIDYDAESMEYLDSTIETIAERLGADGFQLTRQPRPAMPPGP